MYFRRFTVHQSGDDNPLCAAPTAIELKDGSLLTAWYDQNTNAQGELSIKSSVFDPFEGRWISQSMILKTGLLSAGNPILFRMNRETIWLVYNALLGEDWSTCQVRCVQSRDEGKSWNNPNILCPEWGSVIGLKPLVRPDGSVLLPLHKVAGRDAGAAFLLKTINGGYDWSEHSLTHPGAALFQSSLAAKNDGKIMMFLRSKKNESCFLWQSHSSDEGNTWSDVERTQFPNPHCRVDLERLSSGNIIMAYNHSLTTKSPLTIALSEDDGEKWHVQTPIDLVEGEFSNPTLIQTRDNIIHLLYSSRLSRIVHICFDEEWLRTNSLRAKRIVHAPLHSRPIAASSVNGAFTDRYREVMWRPKLVLLQ